MVGGGWAGLAAALALLDRGADVTLLERRARAGGRACSFPHTETGLHLDNGQHVLLGCCARALAFLRRVGAEEAVRFQPLLQVPVIERGRAARLRSARLPGPLHLLPSLMAYAHLTPRQRMRAALAAVALRLGRAPADGEPFSAWLRRHGQEPEAVARLWDLIVTAVLNTRADEASAALAARALRTGFLAGPRAATLGLFRVPLGEVADRAVACLRRGGADVRLGATAVRVEVEGSRACGVHLEDGRYLRVDALVAAVAPDALPSLLPEVWRRAPPFARLAELGWSPILNVYLLYDRPVMRADVSAFVDNDLQFAFNRGALLGRRDLDGRLIGLSVSAADRLTELAADRLTPHLDGLLRAALDSAEARAARLLAAVPVWQPRATFRATPGTTALRPAAGTPLAGLFLAGDWTDTGWPACLEGAVRSGEAAAATLWGALRRPATGATGEVASLSTAHGHRARGRGEGRTDAAAHGGATPLGETACALADGGLQPPVPLPPPAPGPEAPSETGVPAPRTAEALAAVPSTAPDVSFVIPARNERGCVAAALASVAAQAWPPGRLEAVVVDNGSDDGTADVVAAFAASHPQLEVQLVREPARGRSRAKNRGVAAARGELLVFLDADCRAAPDLAERVLARARAGWPAGSIRVVADSPDPLERGFFRLMEFGKRHLGIRAQLFYCRRDAFAAAGGFREDLELAEDLDLLVRLRRARYPVCHLSDTWIATSPRRLRALPLRLGLLTVFVRWALAHFGIGRRWRY